MPTNTSPFPPSYFTRSYFTSNYFGSSTMAGSVAINTPLTGGTPGAVLFVGSGPALSQDAANFAWNVSTRSLKVGSASLGTANGSTTLTTAATEQVLEQTGDTLGATRLHLQNRVGMNGALFENASLDLVDFGFRTSTGTQRNLRLENRSIYTFGSAPEFQLGQGGNPSLTTSDTATIVRRGRFGVLALAAGTGQVLAGVAEIDNTQTAADKVLVIRGATGQTGSLQEWQTVSGVRLAAVTPAGEVRAAGFAPAFVTRTSAYALTTADGVVVANAASGAFSVTLPGAATVSAGRIFTVKKIDTSANVVTLAAVGSDLIDGGSKVQLSTAWKYVSLASNGVNAWYVVGNN